VTFRRLPPRLGYQQAIRAIAHRLCRLFWPILHEGVRYQERGLEVSAKSKRTRTARTIGELRKLGYRAEGGLLPAANPACFPASTRHASRRQPGMLPAANPA
jgi:hypothetical protein